MDTSLNGSFLQNNRRNVSTSPIPVRRNMTPVFNNESKTPDISPRIIEKGSFIPNISDNVEKSIKKITSGPSHVVNSNSQIGQVGQPMPIKTLASNLNNFMNNINSNRVNTGDQHITVTKRVLNVSVERGPSSSPLPQKRLDSNKYLGDNDSRPWNLLQGNSQYQHSPMTTSMTSKISSERQNINLDSNKLPHSYQCNSEKISLYVPKNNRPTNEKNSNIAEDFNSSPKRSDQISNMQGSFIKSSNIVDNTLSSKNINDGYQRYSPLEEDFQLQKQKYSVRSKLSNLNNNFEYIEPKNSEELLLLKIENKKLKDELINFQNILKEELAHFDQNFKIPERRLDEKLIEVLQLKNNEILNLKNHIENLIKAQKDSVNTEKEIIKCSTIIQNADIEEMNKLRNSLLSANKDNISLKIEMNKLSQALQEENDKNSILRQDMISLKAEAELKLESEKTAFDQTLNHSRQDLEFLKSEHSNILVKLRNGYDSETENLNNKMLIERQRNESLQSNIINISSQLEEKTISINKLTIELDQTKEKLSEIQSFSSEVEYNLKNESESNAKLKELIKQKEKDSIDKIIHHQLKGQLEDQQETIKMYEKKIAEYQSEIDRIFNDFKRIKQQNEFDNIVEQQNSQKREDKLKNLQEELHLVKNLNKTQEEVINDLQEKIFKLEKELSDFVSRNIDHQTQIQHNYPTEHFGQIPDLPLGNYPSHHNIDSPYLDKGQIDYNFKYHENILSHQGSYNKDFFDANDKRMSQKSNNLQDYSLNSDNYLIHAENNLQRFSKQNIPVVYNPLNVNDCIESQDIEEIELVEEDVALNHNDSQFYNKMENQYQKILNQHYESESNAEVNKKTNYDGKYKKINEELKLLNNELQQNYENLLVEFQNLKESEREAAKQNQLMVDNLKELNEEISLWKSSIETYKNRLWEILAKAPLKHQEIEELIESKSCEDPVLLLKRIFEILQHHSTKITIDDFTEIDHEFEQNIKVEKILVENNCQTDKEQKTVIDLFEKKVQASPITLDNSNNVYSRREIFDNKAIQTVNEDNRNKRDAAILAKITNTDQSCQIDAIIKQDLIKVNTHVHVQTDDDLSMELLEIRSGVTADDIFKKKGNMDEIVSPVLPRINIHRFSLAENNSEEKLFPSSPSQGDLEDFRVRFIEQYNLCQQISDQNISLMQANSDLENHIKQLNSKIRQYKRTLSKAKSDLQSAQIAAVELAQLKSKLSEQEQLKSDNIFQMRSGNDSLGIPQTLHAGRRFSDDEVEKLKIENHELSQKYKELVENIKGKRRLLMGELKGMVQLKQNFQNTLVTTFVSGDSIQTK
jgi:hypothetical protein